MTAQAYRRDMLQTVASLPFAALLARTGEWPSKRRAPARARDTKASPQINFEQVISGPLAEVRGRFKLRITELRLSRGHAGGTTRRSRDTAGHGGR